ncbi:MAG: PilZ domain-containing protein [Thermodesulfobacteriota bacterium]
MSTQEKTPSVNEKRKHPRIETENEVDYILLDTNRERVGYGKARALNLSQSGVLLETETPLEGSFVILMTLDLDGNQVQVKGRIANTRESDKPGCYLTGIRFTGSKKEHKNAIIAFVKKYTHRKHSGRNSQSQGPEAES